MSTRREIQEQADEIYNVISEYYKQMKINYVQSWWLNPGNTNLKSMLKTPQINSRCRLLVKQGKLSIDKSKTSTSTGTRYILTQTP